MSAGKFSWDVIVIGSSLEAAIATALLARRGWTAAWVGGAASPTVRVGSHELAGAPSLIPSRSCTPALNRVLDELKLVPSHAPLGPAASWQLLGDRLRATLPADAGRIAEGEGDLDLIKATANEGVAATALPLTLGWLGERAARKRRIPAPEIASSSTVAGAVGPVSNLLALGDPANAAPYLAEPHDLPGGALQLGAMLQGYSSKLGVRVFGDGLRKRLEALRFHWSEVRCTLSTNDELTGRVLLFALPDEDIEAVLPESLNTRRFRRQERVPLLRLALVIRSRGLPAALGRFAFLANGARIWIERQPINSESEGVTLFWRSDQTGLEGQRDAVMLALDQVAPFVGSHIEASEGPEPVPQHWVGGDRQWRLARRVLDARGPLLGFRGVEGAAVAGSALAYRAMQLSPRKNLLK